jgi:hypothetical protein
MDAAMWAMQSLAGPSLKQFDTKQMRDLVDDAMAGKAVVRNWNEYNPDEQKEMREALDNEFIDNYVEIWPGFFGIGDKDELSVLRMPFAGEVVHIPVDFADRYKQLATGYSNIYGMDTASGRKQAMASASDQMLQEGWTLDKDAISSTFADTIFGFGMFEGVSDNLITNRPSAIWRNDSLRSIIDDEDVIQASYKEAESFIKNSTSWAAFNGDGGGGRTPKVGINVQLSKANGPYNGRFMREDGNLEYGFVALALDDRGNMRPIQDEENLNNNKIFFFGLTQAQVAARKARVLQESKSNTTKNAERRARRQIEDQQRREQGFRPGGQGL